MQDAKENKANTEVINFGFALWASLVVGYCYTYLLIFGLTYSLPSSIQNNFSSLGGNNKYNMYLLLWAVALLHYFWFKQVAAERGLYRTIPGLILGHLLSAMGGFVLFYIVGFIAVLYSILNMPIW